MHGKYKAATAFSRRPASFKTAVQSATPSVPSPSPTGLDRHPARGGAPTAQPGLDDGNTKRYLPHAGRGPPPAASTGARATAAWRRARPTPPPSPFQIAHLPAGRTPTRLRATGVDSHWRRRGCTSRGAGRHSRSTTGPGRGESGGRGRTAWSQHPTPNFLVAAWAAPKQGQKANTAASKAPNRHQTATKLPPNRRARTPAPCKQRGSRQEPRPEAQRRGPFCEGGAGPEGRPWWPHAVTRAVLLIQGALRGGGVVCTT